MTLTYISGWINTAPGFLLVIFPFLCEENHKLSNSILDYGNDIPVTGLLLSMIGLVIYVMFCWRLALNSTVGNCRPIRLQIVSIFIRLI